MGRWRREVEDRGALKAPRKVRFWMWSKGKKIWELQVSEGLCMLPEVESGFIHYMKSIYHMVSLSILKKICFLSLQRHFLPGTDFPSMWQQFKFISEWQLMLHQCEPVNDSFLRNSQETLEGIKKLLVNNLFLI